MDGRDIGTNVIPNAKAKIYLDANVEVRTERRCHELEEKGISFDKNVIRKEIIDRDNFDKNMIIVKSNLRVRDLWVTFYF